MLGSMLKQFGRKPIIPLEEQYCRGDVFVKEDDTEIGYDAEVRNTTAWTEDKTPGHDTKYKYNTISVPFRKVEKSTADVHVQFDPTSCHAVAIGVDDIYAAPSIEKNTTRGADKFADVPIEDVLVFHRASPTAKWKVCSECGAMAQKETRRSKKLKGYFNL